MTLLPFPIDTAEVRTILVVYMHTISPSPMAFLYCLAERCAPARSVLSTLNHGARWKSLRVCFSQGFRFRVCLGNSTLQRRKDVAGGVSPGTRVVQCPAGERPGRGEANIVLELEEGEIRDIIRSKLRQKGVSTCGTIGVRDCPWLRTG